MNTITFKQKISDAISAGFAGIWISSFEHQDAIAEIANISNEIAAVLLMWNPETGLSEIKNDKVLSHPAIKDPLTALQHLNQVNLGSGETAVRGVMVMRNLHPYLFTPDQRIINPALLQTVQHTIERGAKDGRHVIVLSYENVRLIPELEKMFYVIDHDLPDADELYKLASEVDPETPMPERQSDQAELVLNAAAGLTRIEAAGAFAMSIARHGDIQPDTLWEIKEGMLKKSGLLEMYRPVSGFESLGGLNHVKEFCLRAFGVDAEGKPVRKRDVKAKPKGILLVGLPGSGKSHFAKALGYQVSRPTIILDVGSLMGGIVGQSEANTRRALRIIDAMAPCVLMVDEIEKALAGAGGGALDSGVSDRMFGTFLTWLNDHESEVFTIATCNDIRKLAAASSGAFARAERFDGVFFMDMPVVAQRLAIWDIYIKHYELTAEQSAHRPVDEDWTGAEIRACCRLARLLDENLVDAGARIVPVSRTSKEQVESLREWAHHRCLSADYKGVYDKNGPKKFMTAEEINARPRRRVTRISK